MSNAFCSFFRVVFNPISSFNTSQRLHTVISQTGFFPECFRLNRLPILLMADPKTFEIVAEALFCQYRPGTESSLIDCGVRITAGWGQANALLVFLNRSHFLLLFPRIGTSFWGFKEIIETPMFLGFFTTFLFCNCKGWERDCEGWKSKPQHPSIYPSIQLHKCGRRL